MFDVPTVVSSVIAALSAGGWLMSRHLRKKEDEKHAVELEHARAESDALRQRTELDYTKEVLEIYSAHIVKPLQQQINDIKERLKQDEEAIRATYSCRLYPDCPVISRLQKQGESSATE